MFCDITLMERSEGVEKFGNNLGFSRIFFKEDFGKLGIVISKDYDTDRKLVERRKVKILVDVHVNNSRDNLHFRSSGLNQVICKFMNKNNVALGMSLGSIKDGIMLGRIKQNIILCRKYKVKIKFFSFAKSKYEMRAREDMISFLRAIGMNGKEAKEALSY